MTALTLTHPRGPSPAMERALAEVERGARRCVILAIRSRALAFLSDHGQLDIIEPGLSERNTCDLAKHIDDLYRMARRESVKRYASIYPATDLVNLRAALLAARVLRAREWRAERQAA